MLSAAKIADHAHDPVDRVVLDYADRIVRRKRLTGLDGLSFVVDLPRATHLDPGQAFVLSDNSHVAIDAAEEPLIEIRGDLARLAWHIGNRHTPCEVHSDFLRIAEDKVLFDMLQGLGATLARVSGTFTPEGGAYGHGRTMGHDHGHTHQHDHDHDHH